MATTRDDGQKRDNFTMRITADTRERLQSIATRQKRSVAYVVTECIENYLPVLEASSSAASLRLNEPKRVRK